METNKIDVLAALDLFISAHVDGQVPKSDQTAIRNVRAAVAELIEAAARHIHAVDHPVNDDGDAARQERTLRALNAALTNVGGAA